MKINGSAIYATRPVAPYTDGALRYTKGKDGAFYVIRLLAEGEKELPAEITLPGFTAPATASVSVLGAPEATARCVNNSAGGAKLVLSSAARTELPSPYAVVFKLSAP